MPARSSARRTTRPMAFLLLAASSCLLFAQASEAQTIQVNKDNKTIAITANDSAEAEADTADLSIGFTTYGATQDATYTDASNTSNRIVKSLTDAGIPKDAIRSTGQNLSPIDTSDKLRYTQGIRFVLNQSWRVTVKAASAAETLNLAIASGANNGGGIDWRLADDNALQAQAASKALNHAQEIASRMAAGLHASLGPLVYASNQAPDRDIDRLRSFAAMSAPAPPARKALAILPDKVTRSATVYAVFAIQ